MLAFGLAFIIFTTCWISTEGAAVSNRRQLDIPAMRSYFDKLFPDKESGELKTSVQQPKDKMIIGLIAPSIGTAALNSPATSIGNRPSNNTASPLHYSILGKQSVDNISTSGRVRSLGAPEQSRPLRQKGELGNAQLKNAALVPVASPGLPFIGVVADIPLSQPISITSPIDPYSVGVRDPFIPQPYPERPPLNILHTSLKGLKKAYGAPKATYGPPKAANKPSKGYGAPPKQAYGAPPVGPGFGGSIGGVLNIASPLPGTGPIDPLKPIGTVPNDPTLADPGLVSSILNSPLPYVLPSFPDKTPGSGGPTRDPLSVFLQKPPFKGSGLTPSLADSPLNDGYAGLGDSGSAVPIQNNAYPPLVDDFSVFSPLQGPNLHPNDGPVSLPLPGESGYDEGLSDGVGHVSSFSYFHGPEFAKDLDYRHSDAERIIAEQFHLYMTDRTGFPGIARFRELEENTVRGTQKKKKLVEDKNVGTNWKPGPETKQSTTSTKPSKSLS